MSRFTQSSKLVSRLRGEVPEHLRDGVKFRSLLNFTEPIFAPFICMKFTLDVDDQHAFRSMLWTLHYWGVTTLPSEAIAFALSSPGCLTEDRDIEFLTSSIPSLLVLIKLAGYPKSEWLQYAMQDGDLHVVRHLIEREGLLWNEHCAIAAIQYNHIECLKYACATQCTLSTLAYELTARGEGNDCVKYLRQRLNLTDATTVPEMVPFGIADYQYALWGLAVISLSGMFVGKLLNRA